MNVALKITRRFNWDDYHSWPDDERWELVAGEAFAMSPSPCVRHQALTTKIASMFTEYLRGQACRPFVAPLDVKLSDEDVVQPDVLVVCDSSRIKAAHIEGAPDLVVEIVSPASEKHDRVTKMKLYERCGVREYWIVTPFPPLLEIYVADRSRLVLHAGGMQGDDIESVLFPELKIDLAAIFDLAYTDEERGIFEVKESPARYAGVGTK